MSYDINFWKQSRPLRRSSEKVYARLCEGKKVDGLETLPVDIILARLRNEFPSFDPQEEFPLVSLDNGSIEIIWSDEHFRFDFRGDVPGDVQNRLVAMMAEFGCPLYDPQMDERYDAERGMAIGEPPDFTASEDIDVAVMAEVLKESLAEAGIELGDLSSPEEVLEKITKAAGVDAQGATPQDLTLLRVSRDHCEEDEWLVEQSAAAHDRGYEYAGDFAAASLSIVLRALFKPPNIFACLYRHEVLATWIDIVAIHTDDTLSTWTTSIFNDSRVPPWTMRDVLNCVSFAEADDARLAAEVDKPAAELTGADFERVFCESYAREVAWRGTA